MADVTVRSGLLSCGTVHVDDTGGRGRPVVLIHGWPHNGRDRLRSVVFAAAVTPYMAQTEDDPDGPLTKDLAQQMTEDLDTDREGFFERLLTGFLSA